MVAGGWLGWSRGPARASFSIEQTNVRAAQQIRAMRDFTIRSSEERVSETALCAGVNATLEFLA
jgi:hypothetical protein